MSIPVEHVERSSGRVPRRADEVCPPASVIRREVVLHGRVTSFLEAGADSGGPVLVLLHGLASSSQTWVDVAPLLGRHAHVVAPDFVGHGRSAKPDSGDYSLGAYAADVRDLLLVLGLGRATVVGHSLGGGVAMQYVHQFPELVERLVLVSSGGLGHEVTPALRAATLPGAGTVLRAAPALLPPWLVRVGHRTARVVPALRSVLPDAELDGMADAVGSFTDHGARDAFVHTVRGMLDGTGQRVAGTDRLYLLDDLPVLLMAGSRDPVIPVEHTRAAHAAIPGSRLEIVDGAGHFPHAADPARFAATLDGFIGSTEAAHHDLETLRRKLQEVADVPATPFDASVQIGSGRLA